MYKATIYFEGYKDDYTEGESTNSDSSWEQELTADTQSELRNKVLEATYSKWSDLDDEQINEYDWCTEYHTGYMANANNEGEASEQELADFAEGKCELWAIHCHILVTEVTEKKASL